jgi:hypothetical protein
MQGKQFLTSPLLGIAVTIAISLVLLTYVHSQAKELRYPVPSYEGKDLERVRQWEKTWVGEKINHSNIDQVKEYIPESLYQLMSDPQTWGEGRFEIVPYREIKPTKGELKFTRNYAGTCSIGPDEELLNYVCGIPFPNPRTGLEIAHNFDNLNQGDNVQSLQDMWLIDGKMHYDRKMVMDSHMLFFSGRRTIPPLPELPNPKGIFRASHNQFHEPASMRGTRSLSIKWKDRTKPFESHSFSSISRKTVRKSTAERTGSQGGADMCSDDNLIFDNAISKMTYKYLGRKELLLARHQDLDQFKKGHREGYCLFNGFQRERINMYVLECYHKNPNYVYSKQVWYVDPETWWILYSDKYDRQGKLLRIFENAQYPAKSVYNGELNGSIGFMLIIDLQRLHATGGFSNIIFGGSGEFYDPGYYTPKALQKYGY